jgi:hypothetical protein
MQKLSSVIRISEEVSAHDREAIHCLNCGQALPGPYCAYCGQKGSTHRYSIKHFVLHDLVHGVWHVDKGLLFTLKGLFTRPGHSVRAFIEGKRMRYFNCITLIALILGFGHFLGALSPIKLADIYPESSRAAMSAVEHLMAKYPKLVLLVTIPVYSIFSFLWFRKARLNGSEHLVLNTYKAAAEMIIGLLFTVITIFYHNKQALYLIYNGISLLVLVYSVWFYYQYFSRFGYKRYSLLLRSLMIPVSISLFYLLLGIIAAVLTRRAA